jgi:APA family basic amino acid/polyamine antiporter
MGIFKLRIRGESVIRMPGYPLLPALFIIFSLVILVLAYLERPVESSIAVGIILVGIPAYFYLRK